MTKNKSEIHGIWFHLSSLQICFDLGLLAQLRVLDATDCVYMIKFPSKLATKSYNIE